MYVKANGTEGSAKRPGPTAVAKEWSVPAVRLQEMESAAIADGALKIEDGLWVVTGWDKYQKPDRTNALRKRRLRESRIPPVRGRYGGGTRRATKTVTETTSKPLGSSVDDPPGFVEAWKLYPRRQGGNPRKLALQAWRARIREGIPAADLIAAVKRYRSHVESTGKEGTEFVLQASTFFGPKERWREDYGTNGRGNGQQYHRLRLDEL